MARRAKKRLQEPELRWRGEPDYGYRSQSSGELERPESQRGQKSQSSGELERPESQFPPRRKREGGKEGPGGIIYIRYYNNYIIILYYMIARPRDEPGLPWENNPADVYIINSYRVHTVSLCL